MGSLVADHHRRIEPSGSRDDAKGNKPRPARGRAGPRGQMGGQDSARVLVTLDPTQAIERWNEGIDKIKLFTTNDKSELLVKFIAPKSLQCQMVWQMGMQSSMLLVNAVNIGTAGFFWWYLPTFISKFAESVFDLEQKTEVLLERSPQLKISWGHLALSREDLKQVRIVLMHMIKLQIGRASCRE